MNEEQKRLDDRKEKKENWRLWGPYLAERAWATVREDYSADGAAWEHFSHDQARRRAYRWNEDGLGGICDEKQYLCLALALWNGRDPILKERAFGLTGNEGNHGEDVKECYFYLDATPSHSYLRYLYKYPQAEYPYSLLLEENRRRGRRDPSFNLLDTGIFNESRYWDVELIYAKFDPEAILLRINIYNRGPSMATLHVLPTLWFRNTWSWGDETAKKPTLYAFDSPEGAAWAVHAAHPELGVYHLYGAQPAELLFTGNETDFQGLWGIPNQSLYVKDAFHRLVIHGERSAVNPALEGTKCAAWYRLSVPPASESHLELMLVSENAKESFKAGGHPTSSKPETSVLRQTMANLVGFMFSPQESRESFKGFDKVMETRKSEADRFYHDVLPGATEEDGAILRQALSGLIWTKQFFHYDVARWLDGDQVPPPESRKRGRNHKWRHLKSANVILMPDSWEYPWFVAWDLAFHCVALALIDIDFAKEQLEMLLTNRYLHPDGQIPGCEWAFDDVNPPLLAWAALECFQMERTRTGIGDLGFLRRMFNKLVLNYGWWLNRRDPGNRGVFEGGALGLDNISIYDRSQPLPPGFSLKQADASAWMAMYALNLTTMAIELAREDPGYEEMAIQFHAQFFAVANAVHGHGDGSVSLWDSTEAFFKDVLDTPDGAFPLPVFSWVGLIPLFGVEIGYPEQLAALTRYKDFLKGHAGGTYDGNIICACPHTENERGEHFFSLPLPSNVPEIMERVLNADQFISPHGVRSLSKVHRTTMGLGDLPVLGSVMIAYEPGESQSGLFGGNSNWRGPIWFPLNYLLVRALDKAHEYLTDTFAVNAPGLGGRMTLKQAADVIAERLIGIFRRDERGLRPAFPEESPFQKDPHWRDLLLFYEYFHGDTGQGLGAAHQTGWTALVANLLKRHYERSEGEEAKVRH